MKTYYLFFIAILSPSVAFTADITLEYQRADGMFAAEGKPSATLGVETLEIAPGAIVELDTDWKFEKQKGTQTQPYGSHLRIAKNNSNYTLTLFLRYGLYQVKDVLQPGVTKKYKADLMAVEASPQPLSKDDLGKRCIFEYRRADNAGNQVGLPSNSLGAETVTMRPGERIFFDTDWKYEKKKGTATQRYGSHLRRAVNKGEGTIVRVRHAENITERLRQNLPKNMYWGLFKGAEELAKSMEYNVPAEFKSDLFLIDCLRK